MKKETLGRKGKTDGQPAHTREVKLGCVFTQSAWDKKGYAIRDPDSTTYTGAIETAEEFGKRIYLEAWNCGWSRAAKKVVMGDGAEWIWNLADQHFPGAVQIVDLYHARQHLWDLARKLGSDTGANGLAEFKGKRVLVTGGTKGAGKAIATRFLQGGATVAITARSAPTETTVAHFIQADSRHPGYGARRPRDIEPV